MSDEPVRWVDDPAAPASLRGDLNRVAGAAGPHYELEAGLARLTAAIGTLPPSGGGRGGPSGPADGGASAATGGAAAATAKAGSVLTSGIFWGLTACGVAGGALIWFSPIGERPTPAPVPIVQPAVAGAATTTEDAKRPVEEIVAAPTIEAPNAKPASATPAPSDVRAAAEAPSSSPSAAASVTNDFPEMEHLALLRTAARNDPARALELSAEGQRRFSKGIYGEEREAIAIRAMARLGRLAEAKRRAQAFVAAHPTSVFAEQVRRETALDEAH